MRIGCSRNLQTGKSRIRLVKPETAVSATEPVETRQGSRGSGSGAREKGSGSEYRAKSKIMQERRVGLRFFFQIQGFSVAAAAAGGLPNYL